MFRRLFRRPAPEPASATLEEGWAAVREHRYVEALRWVTRREATPPLPPGFFHLKSAVLDGVGRHEESLEALVHELRLHPENAEARRRHDELARALAIPAAAPIPTAERGFGTSLPRETLLRIQQSLHNYRYRGVPLLKNPFDFALYPLLLERLRPRTILEIGSKSGGSALWYGDLMDAMGIDGRILSVDVVRVTDVRHPRVTFLEGDGRALEGALPARLLERLPRPWLVVEDADHAYETTSAVLRYLHAWVKPGDYVVVEDGIISDLTADPTYGSGPHRALKELFQRHPGEYEVDAELCDFFGYNLTWCTNGWLRRVAPVPQREGASAPAAAPASPASPAPPAADPLAHVRGLVDRFQGADALPELGRIKAAGVPVRDVDYLRARCFLQQRKTEAATVALQEELRYFPDHRAARGLLQRLTESADEAPRVEDLAFRELYRAVEGHTMLAEARLHALYEGLRSVCAAGVPGHVVECGVAAGGSSALLAATLARHGGDGRRLFAFDTFEGMPPPTAEDTSGGTPALATGWGAGTCAAPEASLREICRRLGVDDRVEAVRGLFADTLPVHRERIGPVALLHMDGDWYASTLDILESLYDQVSPGGRIQIDDYGFWDGCRRALDDFAARRGLSFTLHEIDGTGVWMTKPS